MNQVIIQPAKQLPLSLRQRMQQQLKNRGKQFFKDLVSQGGLLGPDHRQRAAKYGALGVKYGFNALKKGYTLGKTKLIQKIDEKLQKLQKGQLQLQRKVASKNLERQTQKLQQMIQQPADKGGKFAQKLAQRSGGMMLMVQKTYNPNQKHISSIDKKDILNTQKLIQQSII